MRRLIAGVAVLACVLLVATGCGDDEAPPTEGSEPVSFEITFEGDTVTPSGVEEKVARGQDVELVVEADAPGELHVHSTPEQQLSYAAGTTTLRVNLANQPPGVVDIESHTLDQLVLRLEIS